MTRSSLSDSTARSAIFSRCVAYLSIVCISSVGLALTKLGADARGEFGAIERERDGVVGAEIQGVRAVGGSAGDDHDDLQSANVGARFERGNEAGAVEIVRAGLGDKHFRRKRENLI